MDWVMATVESPNYKQIHLYLHITITMATINWLAITMITVLLLSIIRMGSVIISITNSPFHSTLINSMDCRVDVLGLHSLFLDIRLVIWVVIRWVVLIMSCISQWVVGLWSVVGLEVFYHLIGLVSMDSTILVTFIVLMLMTIVRLIRLSSISSLILSFHITIRVNSIRSRGLLSYSYSLC